MRRRGRRLLRDDVDPRDVSGITRSYRVGPPTYAAATPATLVSPGAREARPLRGGGRGRPRQFPRARCAARRERLERALCDREEGRFPAAVGRRALLPLR